MARREVDFDPLIELLSDVYGSASVETKSSTDVTAIFSPQGANGVCLALNETGAPNGLGWVPNEEQGHGLTFGATRSGKGVSAIIPALLSYNGSMVVIDPKGENAWVTAERRRQLGQRVVILDPWHEVNRRFGGGKEVEAITRFNPLSSLDPDDLDFADEVSAIADALIISQDKQNPHWDESARELVAGLIAAVVERRPGEASLAEVRKLLTNADELAATLQSIRQSRPDSLGALKLHRFTKSTNEVEGVRSTAETQTAVLDNARLQHAMETDDPAFDLTELATGQVTLYLVLPLDRLSTHGRWLRLILTLAIRAVARQAEPPVRPVLFMMDEMGTVGRLEVIEQAYGLMAGIGIRLWGFLQDINQLQRDYPRSWETFIANSAFMQVLNARDITTSEYVSKYIGNKTIQITVNEPGKWKYYDKHDQAHSRPVYYPDEIRRMSNNKQMVLYSILGLNFYMSRIVYFDDPRWRGLYRPIPRFARQPETLKVEPAPPPPPRRSPRRKGWFGKR